jgi:hypothetical protein
MTTTNTATPDLLRRFVPAPNRTIAEVDGVEITLHSNDLDLVTALQRAASRYATGTVRHQLQITVIRDGSAPVDQSELTIVNAWPVATVTLGTGTMFAVDYEKREVVGFLASRVSLQYFSDELLSVLIGLSPTTNHQSW